MSLLYVTWDGPGARYLRSLYLPIFARMDAPVDVLQVTYGASAEVVATAEVARQLGVGYRAVHFHRRNSTFSTVATGTPRLAAEVFREVWSKPNRLVMARSLVPAAAVMSSGIPSRRFIFDADGLVADERLEFAGWSGKGVPYRMARQIERQALQRAAVTLTRTRAAAQVLASRSDVPLQSIIVAPNGSDEACFKPLSWTERASRRSAMGIAPSDCVVVYCGTLGPQYHPELMAHFVRSMRAHKAVGKTHFLVLTADEMAALSLLKNAECGAEDGHWRSVDPAAVPGYLGLADFALAFREPSFSQRAVAPIKVGEYLLCGVPVVANGGVGDLDDILDETVSVMCQLNPVAVAAAVEIAAIRQFNTDVVRRCGLEAFSIKVAVRGYQLAVDRAGDVA